MITFWILERCINWNIFAAITIWSIQPVVNALLQISVVGFPDGKFDDEVIEVDQISIDSFDSFKVAYTRSCSKNKKGS